MLYPKDICYGDAKVEVSLTAPIAHSTARLLEFFYENDSPVVCSLTEDEKMSLELWAKVGGDGQVGNIARENATNCHVLVHVSVCVRIFNRVKFLVRVRVRVRVPGHEPEHRHWTWTETWIKNKKFTWAFSNLQENAKTTSEYCWIYYIAGNSCYEVNQAISLGRFIFCGPGKTTKRYCLIHYVAN
jgi:hypothetical protein